MNRALAVLLAGLPTLVALARPGSAATNYGSEITSAPQDEGLSFRVIGADEYLGVTSSSDEELVVEGY